VHRVQRFSRVSLRQCDRLQRERAGVLAVVVALDRDLVELAVALDQQEAAAVRAQRIGVVERPRRLQLGNRAGLAVVDRVLRTTH
jgi:hypothetical protein